MSWNLIKDLRITPVHGTYCSSHNNLKVYEIWRNANCRRTIGINSAMLWLSKIISTNFFLLIPTKLPETLKNSTFPRWGSNKKKEVVIASLSLIICLLFTILHAFSLKVIQIIDYYVHITVFIREFPGYWHRTEV